jgi:hypothetical protein
MFFRNSHDTSRAPNENNVHAWTLNCDSVSAMQGFTFFCHCNFPVCPRARGVGILSPIVSATSSHLQVVTTRASIHDHESLIVESTPTKCPRSYLQLRLSTASEATHHRHRNVRPSKRKPKPLTPDCLLPQTPMARIPRSCPRFYNAPPRASRRSWPRRSRYAKDT